MTPTSRYNFGLRWKEELVADIPGGKFVMGAPMGVLSVDFPTESTRERFAPDWAKGRWGEVGTELKKWCENEGIPFYSEEGAWIQFE